MSCAPCAARATGHRHRCVFCAVRSASLRATSSLCGTGLGTTTWLAPYIPSRRPPPPAASHVRHDRCFHGIDAQYTGTADGLTVRDCFFRDIHQPFDGYQPSGGNWAAAIIVQSRRGDARARNVTVTNCVATRVDVFFDMAIALDGLTLRGNTVRDGVGIIASFSVCDDHIRPLLCSAFNFFTAPVCGWRCGSGVSHLSH